MSAVAGHASNNPEEQALASDDPTLLKIVSVLREYGGVILAGPPGTSKSWYAAANALSHGVDVRRAFVQLHPSYQYEDFMQGLAPRLDGVGFARTDGILVRMCRRASATPDVEFVLVVDELSRGEPARVFGEALTYLEQ
ncbi:AAA family ATPase [Pseudokineococcus sp. 1T1Z-3]|uniref:AAA family ATPase n=1 Tax=Pseudokineococcus sp. 1T1Z-3 TaxID=3132745 RepID=UPI00403EF935